MDPLLIVGLRSTGLSHFQECLAQWGFRMPSDLILFDEWDFCQAGMTRVEARKLLSIAVLPQYQYPAPEQQIDGRRLRDAYALAVAVTEAEAHAYSLLETSLDIALKVQTGPPDGPEDISVQEVNQAMQSLVQPPRQPSQAMYALK